MADDIDPKVAAERRNAGRARRGGVDTPARPASRPAPLRSPKPAAPMPQPPAARRAPASPLTSPGGSGPPVPPTGRSLTTSPAADSGPGARSFDSTRNVPATRPSPGSLARPGMPPLRPGALPRGGGGLAALGFAAGEGFDRARDYVNREYPRVLNTEQDESRATGVSTLAADAPSRISGRRGGVAIPAVGGRPGPPLDPEEQRGPSRSPEGPPRPMDAPARPRAPAAPRRPTRGGLSEADVLNAAELGRIGRVNRGEEADRPPQFAKGGMVKKPSISKPSIGKFGSAPGRPPSPPKGPKLPAFLTKAKPPKPPTAPKPKALPFAKGGMPKGKY